MQTHEDCNLIGSARMLTEVEGTVKSHQAFNLPFALPPSTLAQSTCNKNQDNVPDMRMEHVPHTHAPVYAYFQSGTYYTML